MPNTFFSYLSVYCQLIHGPPTSRTWVGRGEVFPPSTWHCSLQINFNMNISSESRDWVCLIFIESSRRFPKPLLILDDFFTSFTHEQQINVLQYFWIWNPCTIVFFSKANYFSIELVIWSLINILLILLIQVLTLLSKFIQCFSTLLLPIEGSQLFSASVGPLACWLWAGFRQWKVPAGDQKAGGERGQNLPFPHFPLLSAESLRAAVFFCDFRTCTGTLLC